MKINLALLHPKYIRAVTKPIADAMQEACEISLECNDHKPGVNLRIQGDIEENAVISWALKNQPERVRKWDPDNASELGATCIALLTIGELTDLVAYDRAYKGNGFDYWLVTKGTTNVEVPFDRKSYHGRMEISGIRKGSKSDISNRVKRKLAQVTPSDDMNLPAYIMVVEFGSPVLKNAIKKT